MKRKNLSWSLWLYFSFRSYQNAHLGYDYCKTQCSQPGSLQAAPFSVYPHFFHLSSYHFLSQWSGEKARILMRKAVFSADFLPKQFLLFIFLCSSCNVVRIIKCKSNVCLFVWMYVYAHILFLWRLLIMVQACCPRITVQSTKGFSNAYWMCEYEK